MKKSLLILACMSIVHITFAQFAIGTRTITYNDPNRTGGFGSGGGPGRQIQCEVYYPATSAGTNTPVLDGEFPVVVFGHGFAMEWSAYQNIWQHLVPQGYIMIFPRTEGGFFPAPSHNDFGLDLALVSERLLEEDEIFASPFYQKINGNSAIMGHSMGGGATILSAQNNSNIKTIIGLAPAETNPSAVSAAANVTVPALVLSGSSDGVTPPAEHHIPIYNGLSSSCKSFVSLTGGAHCYFANTNFNCDLGEGASSSGITLNRAEQQTMMNSLITPWLDYYLKDECLGYSNFQAASAANGLVLTQSCAVAPLTVTVSVTNASSNLNNGSVMLTITGGNPPINLIWSNGSTMNPETNLTPGDYYVIVTDATCSDTIFFTVGNDTEPASLSAHFSQQITLHPNPTKGNISVQSELSEPFSIEIMDASGRLVIRENGLQSTQNSISTDQLQAGVYIIHFQTEWGSFSKRFVKE